MERHSVLIVDDHGLVRAGIRRMVEAFPDFELVGEAADAEDALQQVECLQPDVVLLDISMPGQRGTEVIEPLRRAAPDCRILMLSQHEGRSTVDACFDAGADGFLSKAASVDDFAKALGAVLTGTQTISVGDASDFDSEAPALTRREREVLTLVAEGQTSRSIADLLRISIRTAEAHRANLMHKLECGSVAEVVRYAIRNGMITP